MCIPKKTIDKVISFVRFKTKKYEPGHDWWHAFRVWKNAMQIAGNENINRTVITLSALLHDLADEKFTSASESLKEIKEFLNDLKIEEPAIEHIISIIRSVSFKNREEQTGSMSREFEIVQDADRLDALGAIGIARAFSYGGSRGREMYNPGIKPALNMTKEEYINNPGPTINHFNEKLLRLKDMMHTEKGKELAGGRHQFMVEYLDRFYKEWGREE